MFSRQYLKCSDGLLSHSKLCISHESSGRTKSAELGLLAVIKTQWTLSGAQTEVGCSIYLSFSIYLIFCHIPLQEAVSRIARAADLAGSLAHSQLSYQHVLKGLFLNNRHQLNLLHFWSCPEVSFLQSHSQQLLDFVLVAYCMILIPPHDYSLYDKRS